MFRGGTRARRTAGVPVTGVVGVAAAKAGLPLVMPSSAMVVANSLFDAEVVMDDDISGSLGGDGGKAWFKFMFIIIASGGFLLLSR